MDSPSEQDKVSKFAGVVRKTLNGFDVAITSIMERLNEQEKRLDRIKVDLEKKQGVKSSKTAIELLDAKMLEMRRTIMVHVILISVGSSTVSGTIVLVVGWVIGK